jgi:hypothetical protein
LLCADARSYSRSLAEFVSVLSRRVRAILALSVTVRTRRIAGSMG